MNRKIIICLVTGCLMCIALFVDAQQPKKIPRIGYLSGVDAARESARAELFRLALRELGYIEGQNIATEYRYAEGKIDRFTELAAELVRLKVDIIVVEMAKAHVAALSVSLIELTVVGQKGLGNNS